MITSSRRTRTGSLIDRDHEYDNTDIYDADEYDDDDEDVRWEGEGVESGRWD